MNYYVYGPNSQGEWDFEEFKDKEGALWWIEQSSQASHHPIEHYRLIQGTRLKLKAVTVATKIEAQ